MAHTNPFSINLERQKSQAKKQLKAIRQGDADAFETFQKAHPKGKTFQPDFVKLADVQFALARSLGLPSWSQLKKHAENLAHHEAIIRGENTPPDSDKTTLHVRCGHDIQEALKRAGFKGDYVPFIDPLCLGPITDKADFVEVRAQFVVEHLLSLSTENTSVTDVIAGEQQAIEKLLDSAYSRIVFWIEHDTYDQFMLLRCLSLLPKHRIHQLNIIEVDSYPGSARFDGLGQLPVEAIRSCWQLRKKVSSNLWEAAEQCWKALNADSPNPLINLINQPHSQALPNIQRALFRHLQELPHSEHGLSLTQHIALNVLADKNNDNEFTSFGELFQQYMRKEPLPFLGDMMFYSVLQPLINRPKPLIEIEDSEVIWYRSRLRTTKAAEQCLQGDEYVHQEYWVGGIRINSQHQWRWDHNDLSSMASCY